MRVNLMTCLSLKISASTHSGRDVVLLWVHGEAGILFNLSRVCRIIGLKSKMAT
jgi:hypothetical protein